MRVFHLLRKTGYRLHQARTSSLAHMLSLYQRYATCREWSTHLASTGMYQMDEIDTSLVALERSLPQYAPTQDYLLKRTKFTVHMATLYLHAHNAQAHLPFFFQSPSCGVFMSGSPPLQDSPSSIARCFRAADAIIEIVRSSDFVEHHSSCCLCSEYECIFPQ